MAQLGRAWVEGPAGPIEVPVYETTDVESRLKVQTMAGMGVIPLVPTSDPKATIARLSTPDGVQCIADSIYTPKDMVVYQGSLQEFQWYSASTGNKVRSAALPTDHYPNNRLIADMVANPRDGTFYMIQDGRLWKYDDQGNLLWHKNKVDNPRAKQMALTRNGGIAVAWETELVVFRSDGSIKWWKNPAATIQGVTIDDENSTYLFTDNALYKFDSDGKSKWSNAIVPGSCEGMTVSYGPSKDYLWVASPADQALWRYGTGSGLLDMEIATPWDPYMPRAVPDGTVTIGGGPEDRMALIELNGTVRWEDKIHSGTYDADRTMRPHGIAPDGAGGYVAVFGSWDHLLAFDVTTGTKTVWFNDGNHEAVASEWGLVSTFPEVF